MKNKINKSSNDESVEVNIEEAIVRAGSFGSYQKLVAFAVCFVRVAILGNVFIMYFLANDPPWICVSADTSSFCMQHFGEQIPQSSDLFKQRCILNKSDWIFTKDKAYSIVTEFDLVCDNAWVASLTNSALFIGWGLTGPLIGYLSDTYGRRIMMISSVQLSTISIVALYFINSIWQVILLRMILGAGVGHIYATAIGKEVVGSKHRAIFAAIESFSSYTAYLLIVPLAYYVQNWRNTMLYLSFPAIVSTLISFFVPETVRWLYASGKLSKAEEKIQKIAKFNKKCDQVIQLRDFRESINLVKYSYIDVLFRHLSAVNVVMLMSVNWVAITLLYYGLTLESSNFGDSIYTNFMLSCIMGLLAPLSYLYCANKFGRKKSFLAFTFFSLLSVSTIAVLYFLIENSKELETITLVIALVAKIFASSGFSLLYLWTFELFPTVIRSQGIVVCQIAARVGSAAAPFLTSNLSLVNKSLPFIVMGTFGLVSFFLSFRLIETNNMGTREHFEDLFHDSPKASSLSNEEDPLLGEQKPITNLQQVTGTPA